MNICDNCEAPVRLRRLVLKALIKNRRELIVVNYDAVMRDMDNPIHLCRDCLVKVIVEAKEDNGRSIGFS